MKPAARALTIALAAAAGAACASEPEQPSGFDESAGLVAITVLGDGFVRTGERRVPVEAIVLELRQRVRAMTLDERQRFVVRLLAAELPEGSAAAATARRGFDRLFQELQIMGVKQVRLL